MRRLAVIAIVVIAVIGGAWLLLGRPGGGPAATPDPSLAPVPPSTEVVADGRVVPARHAELRAARPRVLPRFRFRRDDRLAGQPFQCRFFFYRTGRGPPERRFHHAILERMETDHRHPTPGGEMPGDCVEERAER